ncbi:small conductance mechanosensitive channel [Rhodococcus sp. SMB37]|uniref:mechanosensitive ion channel family protein n=1 Tax=Rhodococcus sp. SMB37 TaxID=2512213 RepID=UPI001052DC10|nr:mechanosensitive ion channel family protein [Rhodococcus sp. SMB37]TCN55956.1 small conductance mechanosensitive channel [Rhodococcus sp. SMB37]
MHEFTTLLAFEWEAPSWTEDLVRWVSLQGASLILWTTGALLAARFVQWLVHRITDHIDGAFTESDAIVRSETLKHRHSVAQVIAWIACVVIYAIAFVSVLRNLGLPVTGIVAPATVIGAAIGFGAQRIVQDLLAGFFIIAEKQYAFGDTVNLTLTGAITTEGTVEDVTLRVTQLRSNDGEMVTVPNGQIMKATNLSKDWARAVVDVPVPVGADLSRINDILQEVGHATFLDRRMNKLLFDEPSPMGVTRLELDTVTVRMVARTLPGKQFEVGRDLRRRIVSAFARAGIARLPDNHETENSLGGTS